MTDINTQLVYILNRVKRPGNFYATGKADLAMPRLEVEGMGSVALPLLPQQLSDLVQVAEQAPYGKGEETLVDTTVRKTWQIAPEKVHISGKHWQTMLDGIVAQAVDDLGVTGDVRADFYKLLVYDAGSFFVNHRDTEKAEGMFATLIVALPAVYTGGELRIEHAGQSVALNLQTDDPSEISFTAFYADCVHEVLPITSGCRLVLVYNLCRSGKGALPLPPDYQREQAQAAACLRQWVTMEHTGEDIPLKLVYLLEHAYTPEGLAFAALKNGDAAIASVTIPAAEQADCDLYLALVSVEESGWAEYSGSYGRKPRYWEEEDEEDNDGLEIGEVTEENQYISHWQTPQGVASDMGDLPFEDEELCLPDRLHSLAADALHFHEATGNEGASFERTYRRAALVMWPRAYRADALSTGGVGVTLPYLADLVERWQTAGTAGERDDALHFAKGIIANWEDDDNGHWHSAGHGTPTLSRLLDSLIPLADAELIVTAITRTAISGKSYQRGDNPTLLAALALLPDPQARALLAELITQRAATRLAAGGQLLRLALPRYAAETTTAFLPAAHALLESLANPAAPMHFYEVMAPLNVEQVVDLLIAIGKVDVALGKQAVVHLLAQRQRFSMDDSLIPAVLLAAQASDYPPEVVALLQQQCLAYLESCIAIPLAAPTDATREANFACSSSSWRKNDQVDCEALKRFMLDPQETSWNFAAAEERRNALAKVAQQAKLDVSMTTLKSGRPYTLRFVKTQASYERKVAQRERDEANRERLQGLRVGG